MHGALASSVTLPSADACQACQNNVLRASDASIIVEGIMIAVCIKQGCQLGLICACCLCCADVFVYPGSGATTDTQLLKAQRAAAVQQPAQAAGHAAAADQVSGQPAGAPAATVMNGPVAAGVKAEQGAANSSHLVRG